MTEKDFIIASVDDLVRTFPNTRVRYENHELSNTHFVEVVPNELYRLNDDYQKWEEGIVFKFINLFPSQNICFISDDDIVGIENVDYEMKGELYDLIYSYNQQNYQVIEVKNFTKINADNLFNNIVVVETPILLNEVTDFSFNISNVENVPTDLSSYYYVTVKSAALQNPGNTQYAMAA